MALGPLEDRALNLLKFLGAEPARPGSRFVLLMGITGSGKSTFISRCTGQDAGVGHDLKSCTSEVGIFRFWDGSQDVYLIDTPGFDDTSRSDIDTLRIISYFLSVSFANGNRIDGIIYLHPISQVRFSGSSRRTIDMLKAMIGLNAYPDILIVTTMWDRDQASQQVSRERELMTEAVCFGELLDGGARMKRHAEKGKGEGEETSSANVIVAFLLRHGGRNTKGLRIQREMIEMNMSLNETAAGRVLLEARTKRSETLQKQSVMYEQQAEMEIQARNREAATEFRKKKEEAQTEIKKIKTENTRLNRKLPEIHESEAKKILARLEQMEKSRRASSERKEQNIRDLQEQVNRMKEDISHGKGSRKTPSNHQTQTIQRLESEIKQLRKDLVEKKAREADAVATNSRLRSHILPAIGQFAAAAAPVAIPSKSRLLSLLSQAAIQGSC